MNNFIEHNDPTTPIDLSQVTLEKQFTTLTEQEKLLVGAKFLGMNHLPVDIKTFLFDDYFLGNESITNHGNSVFPYWLDKLETIFPDPIQTKTPYISLGGAIGTGKSFMSKMMGLYHYHRLDCCSNVYASVGLAGGTKLTFGAFHASAETAYRDFVQFWKNTVEISPYFRKLYNNPPIRFIASGPASTGAVIGTQLVYCVLSEINFYRRDLAVAKVEEVLGRYESRFKDKRFNFGGVVCDSSAKDSTQSAAQKFEETVPPRELYKIHPAQWEVRPNLYAESQGQTFDFYIGDNTRTPKVLDPNLDYIKEGLDLDRIIKVPISAKFRFIGDPVRSLQDLAGIPYSGSSLFFGGDLSHLLKCSSLRNLAPEEITVDFYDKSDTIYSHVEQMIYRIPRGTTLFIHYDIGLQKDKTGISLCYYTGEISDPSGTTMYPTFRIPLLFTVSRKAGQSTSLDHLYQFLKDLEKQGFHVVFSADSFASSGIFQSCERDGIEYRSISIDKTLDAGVAFKNIVNTERIDLPYHNILLRECSEIQITTNGKNGTHIKLDHPKVSSCYEFDYAGLKGEQPGTKDLFDAACGSVFSCLQKYSEYLENGNAGVRRNIQALNNIIKSDTEETQKQFQGMLESIF